MNTSTGGHSESSSRQPLVATFIGLAALLLGLAFIGGPLWAVREFRQIIKEIRLEAAKQDETFDPAGIHGSAAGPSRLTTADIDSPIVRFDHPGGRFVKEERVWREYGHPDPTFAFYFREVNRDQAWLYLRDDSRAIDIKLPFQGGQMYLRYYATSPGDWGPLYVVRPVRLSAAVRAAANDSPGAPSPETTSATPTHHPILRFEHSNGRFVKELTDWIEYGNGVAYTFKFRETSRDDKWIYVRDDSRSLGARLPLSGGAMYTRVDDCHPDIWYPYLTVTPVAAELGPTIADSTGPARVEPVQSTDSGDEAVPPAESVQVFKPAPPLNVPRAFTWNYIFQPEPGLRDWRLLNDKMFVERYPSGREIVFVVLRSDTVEEVRGTVVQIVGGRMQAFIPDKGSNKMWLKMRANDTANWQFMGQIDKIE